MRFPLGLRRSPDAVSPTAHYTGQVWVRNGLSHPDLATWEGRVLFNALEPTMRLSGAIGGPTLEASLLSRHRIIDEMLAEAIDDGSVSQVIEIACGMAPRGWRFARRYGKKITYVEADLPAMAERKRRALEQIEPLGEHHRVAELDVLRVEGAGSLESVAAGLDPDGGLAILTEGLLTYLSLDQVLSIWTRFATCLKSFRQGLYLADMRLQGVTRGPLERSFGIVLSTFVRGRVHTHFEDEREAAAALREAGFDEAHLHRCDRHPSGVARDNPANRMLHIIEARVGEPREAGGAAAGPGVAQHTISR